MQQQQQQGGTLAAAFRLATAVLLLSLATVQCDLSVFPSKQLSIMEGAGFLAYLDAPPSTRWIHCSVQINGQSYSLDSDQVHTIGGQTTVERFDASRCGVRVMSLQKSLESSWLLYGTDEAGLEGNATLTITVLCKC